MGEVIRLAERREAAAPRRGSAVARAAEFLFDLACPFSYLAAERVERAFDDVLWTPASTTALRCGSLDSDAARWTPRAAAERPRRRAAAAARVARALPGRVPAAMRAAAYAAEQGRGAAFVLAAGRLAFCGGFDLEDPEILAEAAAAAGIGLDGCLQAAATWRATERSRAPGGDCSPRALTGCPRCASGGRCSGARSGSPRRPRRPGRCGRGAARA